MAKTPNTPFTKMELASRVAGVFDPLGTASPIMVNAKIRLRKLGQDGLQWTDVVGEEDRSWWLLWFKELRRLNDVAMPRCLFPNRLNLEASELHTFVTRRRRLTRPSSTSEVYFPTVKWWSVKSR